MCGLAMWVCCAMAFSQARFLSQNACNAVLGVFSLVSLVLMVGMTRRRANLLLCLLLGASLGLMCGASGSAHMLRNQALIQSLQSSGSTVSFVLEQDASLTQSGFSRAYAALGHLLLEQGDGPRVRVVVEGLEQPPRFGDVVKGSVRWSMPDLGEDYAAVLWSQGAVAVAYVSASEAERQDTGSESAGERGREVWPAAAILQLRNAAIDQIQQQAHALSVAASAATATPATLAAPAANESERDPDPAVGVLQALTCGYRANLKNTAAYQDFQTAGLAHLVAVSGAHLAIVSALIGSVLTAMGVGRGASLGVLAVLMCAYVVFAGAPISALRAAIMAVLCLLSYVPRKQASSLSALGACVMACLVLDVSTATSLSFLLSAGSTLGIALFAQLFRACIRNWARRLPTAIADGLAVSLAASMLSLGVSAAQFSQLSLISPLANVMVAPLLSVVCCGGLVGSLIALALPFASPIAVGLPLLGSKLMTDLVGALARLPLACVPMQLDFGLAVVGSAALAVALWVKWPHVRAKTAAATACVLTLAGVLVWALLPLLAGTQIVALDVGQGDAILLRSQGRAILVDTGNRSNLLRAALARNGVLRLDAVVITHPDSDHCGSLQDLARVVAVDRVCVAQGVLDCGCRKCVDLVQTAREIAPNKQITPLSVGDQLQLGALRLRVVWPWAFEDEGGNADSLCLLAHADVNGDDAIDCTALLTGDAESEQLDQLLALGSVGKVDLLKAGHHGSKACVTQEQLRAFRPAACFISVGEGNRYGHPSPQVVQQLQDAGVQVFRTDLQGDLTCAIDSNGLRISTQWSGAVE